MMGQQVPSLDRRSVGQKIEPGLSQVSAYLYHLLFPYINWNLLRRMSCLQFSAQIIRSHRC